MIITKSEPYSKEEINKLREQFDTYIKTVIDIEKKICSAGMRMHVDGEQSLLQGSSKQSTLWGGGFDVMTGEITYNSFINIRPNDNNMSNFIEKEAVRENFRKLTEFFFQKFI